MGLFLLWSPVVVNLEGGGFWSGWLWLLSRLEVLLKYPETFFEICARGVGGQKMHCCTRVEDAIDGGGGGVVGVGAIIISAVKIINNGGVIN